MSEKESEVNEKQERVKNTVEEKRMKDEEKLLLKREEMGENGFSVIPHGIVKSVHHYHLFHYLQRFLVELFAPFPL